MNLNISIKPRIFSWIIPNCFEQNHTYYCALTASSCYYVTLLPQSIGISITVMAFNINNNMKEMESYYYYFLKRSSSLKFTTKWYTSKCVSMHFENIRSQKSFKNGTHTFNKRNKKVGGYTLKKFECVIHLAISNSNSSQLTIAWWGTQRWTACKACNIWYCEWIGKWLVISYL